MERIILNYEKIKRNYVLIKESHMESEGITWELTCYEISFVIK